MLKYIGIQRRDIRARVLSKQHVKCRIMLTCSWGALHEPRKTMQEPKENHSKNHARTIQTIQMTLTIHKKRGGCNLTLQFRRNYFQLLAPCQESWVKARMRQATVGIPNMKELRNIKGPRLKLEKNPASHRKRLGSTPNWLGEFIERLKCSDEGIGFSRKTTQMSQLPGFGHPVLLLKSTAPRLPSSQFILWYRYTLIQKLKQPLQEGTQK